MENEQMKAVLNEVLENQLELSRSQTEMLGAIQQLKAKLQGLEISLKSRAENSPLLDSRTIQQAVNNGMAEIKLLLQAYTAKPASNNLRVFMESDAKKWAVILIISVFFLTYLYWFVVHKS